MDAVVALDGASFIARKDDAGNCPGEDWQLIAKQGRKGSDGDPGPRGAAGQKGDKGERGESARSDRQAATASATLNRA